MYYYIKNLQGDIVKIINQAGTEVVTYTYDAWGKVLSQTDSTKYNLANINPFKYRGYVYDDESGLYYLQSRYYDPITGRFLNADIYCDTQSGTPLSTNMFACCENNIVMYCDYYGDKKCKVTSTRNLPVVSRGKSVYVIYYSRYKGDKTSGFGYQAKSLYNCYSPSGTFLQEVSTTKEFISAWNKMNNKVDHVFLLLHGGEGTLYFKDGEIKSLSKLNKKILLLLFGYLVAREQ